MFLQNRLLNTTLTYLILLLLSNITFAYQEIDSIVAVIGDDVILQSELQKKSNRLSLALSQKKSTLNKKAIQKKALESLILEKIQLNIAKKAKASVSEKELDSALTIAKNNIQRQGFSLTQYLHKQDLSQDEFVEQVRNEILIDKVQNGAVNRRIRITEKEVDNFLNSKKGKDWISPKFHIGHIFLPATEKNKNNQLKKVKKIYNLLTKKNANFAKLAKKHSQGPNAKKGGDMGIVKKEDLPDLFAEKIASLKADEMTLPFMSDAGIHLLKVFNRTGAQPVVVTQYKTRHLLVKVTELFTEEEAKSKAQKLYDRMISGESLSTLAQKFSDDLGSKSDGGNLGWSLPGKFVPEFEAVMQTTPKGGISQPFASSFGWHIMQVEDIRTKDIFNDVVNQQAANFLRRQRFQDELNIWLQELRENTYVETLI